MGKAGEIGLDEVFLEVFARVPRNDFLAQLGRKLIEPSAEDVKNDA